MGIIIYKSLFHPLDNVIRTTIYIIHKLQTSNDHCVWLIHTRNVYVHYIHSRDDITHTISSSRHNNVKIQYSTTVSYIWDHIIYNPFSSHQIHKVSHIIHQPR